MQTPCSQRGSPCQDPAGSWITQRPDNCKETQTAMVWSCFPFIGSGRTILQGTVKGGRRQGRQRKRWEDNIREWTGLECSRSLKAVENREKWRKQVVKSSVVPQQPSQLRDRRELDWCDVTPFQVPFTGVPKLLAWAPMASLTGHQLEQ